MNLSEWKQYQTLSFREDLKTQMREGIEFASHFLFSESELEDIRQEIVIESFEEVVEFTDELDLEESLIENLSDIQEILDFVPNEDGSTMDLVFEIDLSLIDPSVNSLNKLKEHLFAEDYEMEIIEEDECEDCGKVHEGDCDTDSVNENKAGRAKVIFKRAKGEVKKKKICGPGMRLAGNRCIPQTGSQKAKERRKGIKLKRAKKAMGAGAKKKATLRGKITKRRVKGRSRSYGNTIN